MIHQKIALADNMVELNALTVDLGDKFYNKQQFSEALASYRYARPREQVIRLQNDRIAELQDRIEENLAAIRANPAQITQLTTVNNQLKASIANGKKLLGEFEKLPSITPAIYLRLAVVFTSSIANGKRSSFTRKSSTASRKVRSVNRRSSA